MKTKSLIEKQLQKKTSSNLVQTLIVAKKNEAWTKVADLLSTPKRKQLVVNLSDISSFAKEGETIIIPGKVLSLGELDKKVKIVAFKFSEKAKEKLLKSKSEVSSISEEIKKNPKAEGVKFFK